MKKVRLGAIATVITKGTTPTTLGYNFVDDGVNFVKIESITENGVFLTDKFAHITDECDRKLSRSQLRRNDLLFSIAGAIGRTAIVTEEILPANTNQALAIIRVPEGTIDYFYLKYVLQSPDIVEQFEKRKQGVAQLNISLQDIGDFIIPLRTAEEQKSIVATMDKVSELIAMRKEQLEKLDQLVKSRFIELFGDPIQNTMEWPVCELSECIQFLTSGSRGWSQYFTDEGEYFITIKNVKNCRITLDDVQYIIPPNNAEAKRTKVKEGDLLISITADLGRTGVVTKDIAEHGGYINQHLTCIRLDQNIVRPLYVAYYMESEAGKCQFQSKNQSAVKAGLNFNAINTLRLMLPPIELQDRFIEFIEQVDKSKFEIQQSLEKLETLKKALMQKYFG